MMFKSENNERIIVGILFTFLTHDTDALINFEKLFGGRDRKEQEKIIISWFNIEDFKV